jgi:hypothetical protein
VREGDVAVYFDHLVGACEDMQSRIDIDFETQMYRYRYDPFDQFDPLESPRVRFGSKAEMLKLGCLLVLR